MTDALKIFSVEQIRKWDAFTISNEPISSVELMERASLACNNWILQNLEHANVFRVFCGTGNNGGDGLALARMLADKGKVVHVYWKNSDKLSEDNKLNRHRLIVQGKAVIHDISEEWPAEDWFDSDVIVDALYGTGLQADPDDLSLACIALINSTENFVISIDLPSGMRCDSASMNPLNIVKADITLSFQMPKIQFFFPQFYEFTGEWLILDIGLSLQYYAETGSQYYLLDSEFVSSLIIQRSKFAHKGQFGHALLICGSIGKGGAAVLSGSAALRSGCGLLTMHVPSSILPIVQAQIPEAMAVADKSSDLISECPDIGKYNAIGIGPGIGLNPSTFEVFRDLLERHHHPMVIDADALNLLAGNPELWSKIPVNSILTPHIKEFDRLAGNSSSDMERHQKQKTMALEKKVIVVLKGAYTCICTPEGNVYFNQTGNPGMAKGGSGDVLTGVLTSLLATGYHPLEASLIGVYIHGLAGDLAAEELGETGMIAGDIIHCLPYAFSALEVNERY